MAHTCDHEGCGNPVFGGGFCKYHQYRRKMQGGDMHERKTKAKVPKQGTLLPKESPKRKQEHQRYLDQIKKFWEESIENGTDFCFFCGERMKKHDNIHHLRGRTGKYYLDQEYWVHAHNECHALKYHMMGIERLMKEPWYAGFLVRLKEKDYHSYAKEINKQKKIAKSFED